jgi:hypothetical protein
MATSLDSGLLQKAFCHKILMGGRLPIPVIVADLYNPGASIAGAVGPASIPAVSAPSRMTPFTKLETLCKLPALTRERQQPADRMYVFLGALVVALMLVFLFLKLM